jgi:hypothetical protein
MVSFGPLDFRQLATAAVVLTVSACSQNSGVNAGLPSTPLSAGAGSTLGINVKQLLYVSDSGTNDVEWFGWPKPQNTLGTLTGLSEPQTLCNDGKNVYVVNTGDSNIVVYPAGASSPLLTLEDPGQYPIDCSYDSKYGNLAVGGINSTAFGAQVVSIYTKAKGKPKTVDTSELKSIQGIQYDDSGNLYITATANSGSVLAELPAKSKKLKIVCTKLSTSGGGMISFPGGLAWDGRYIVTSSQNSDVAYRLKGCKAVTTIPLSGSVDIVQIAIAGNRLIGADAGSAAVEIYPYPRGGSPIQTLTGFSQPIGVTVVGAKGK